MTPSEWGHRHQKRGHRCQPIFVLHRGEPTGWGFSEWWRPWWTWSPWRWWWPQWWLPYIEDEEEKAIVASLMIMSMNIIMMICIALYTAGWELYFQKLAFRDKFHIFELWENLHDVTCYFTAEWHMIFLGGGSTFLKRKNPANSSFLNYNFIDLPS